MENNFQDVVIQHFGDQKDGFSNNGLKLIGPGSEAEIPLESLMRQGLQYDQEQMNDHEKSLGDEPGSPKVDRKL